MNIDKFALFQPQITTPYFADGVRSQKIYTNMNSIHQGMRAESVIAILGAPDEANYTFRPIKKQSRANPIGFRFVYLLQRMKAIGSEIEKSEKLIVLHFDNREQLIWSYAKDIKDFAAIEKE